MSIENTDASGGLSEDAAEAALLASLDGPGDQNDNDDGNDEDLDDADDHQDDDPDLNDADDGDEHQDDDDDQGQDDDDNDAGDPDEANKAPALDDDAVVQVEIGGEARDFTLGSLKALAEREETITARGQEAEVVGGRAAATLQAALELAREDLAPYANVDWLVLQNQMEPAEFEWHRQNAGKAQERFNKLVGAAQGFESVMAERKQVETARAAKDCVKVLTDPKQGIPGWSDKLYGEIMSFGVSAGLPEADVAGITNPAVIKLLHKAMLFERGQKVATTKVKAAPTKVIKGSQRNEGGRRAVDTKKAEARLGRTGSDEDAVAVLMGRWS